MYSGTRSISPLLDGRDVRLARSDVELVADVDAGGGQRLAVDLGEQGALREVGRADDDRTTPTGRAGNAAGLGGPTGRRRGGLGASGLGAHGGGGFGARPSTIARHQRPSSRRPIQSLRWTRPRPIRRHRRRTSGTSSRPRHRLGYLRRSSRPSRRRSQRPRSPPDLPRSLRPRRFRSHRRPTPADASVVTPPASVVGAPADAVVVDAPPAVVVGVARRGGGRDLGDRRAGGRVVIVAARAEHDDGGRSQNCDGSVLHGEWGPSSMRAISRHNALTVARVAHVPPRR